MTSREGSKPPRRHNICSALSLRSSHLSLLTRPYTVFFRFTPQSSQVFSCLTSSGLKNINSTPSTTSCGRGSHASPPSPPPSSRGRPLSQLVDLELEEEEDLKGEGSEGRRGRGRWKFGGDGGRLRGAEVGEGHRKSYSVDAGMVANGWRAGWYLFGEGRDLKGAAERGVEQVQ